MTTELNVVTRGKSDEDWAKERLADLRGALTPVVTIMDDLRGKGMQAQFRLGLDGFGRNVIQEISVVKIIA